MPNKKTIILMTPDGARAKTVRIRLRYIVLTVSLLIIGFAGYFIPFNSYTLDVIERTQLKNLSVQNKQLLERVLVSLKLVSNLRSEVSRLEAQKSAIEKGIKSTELPPEPEKPARSRNAASLGLNNLDSIIRHDAAYFERLSKKLDTKKLSFDSIPVLKPVRGVSVVSAIFGRQRDPFTGTIKRHSGMDFSAKQETPVIATASGIISTIDDDRYWGKRIEIAHSSRFSTVYAHLGSVLVGRGSRVKRGDVIATIGLSGLTRGPHLHYEIHRLGTPVNPADYFFPDSLIPAQVPSTAEK